MRRGEQQAWQHQPDPWPVEPRCKLLLDIAPVKQLLCPGLDQQRQQCHWQQRQPGAQGAHLCERHQFDIGGYEFDGQRPDGQQQRDLKHLLHRQRWLPDQAGKAAPMQLGADQHDRKAQGEKAVKLDQQPARCAAARHFGRVGQRHQLQERLHQVHRRQIHHLDQQDSDHQQLRFRPRPGRLDETQMRIIGAPGHQRRIASRAASQPIRISMASIIR